MDPVTIGALGFVVLITMVMLGVHIVFATAITGFLGIVVLKGWTVAANIAGSFPIVPGQTTCSASFPCSS